MQRPAQAYDAEGVQDHDLNHAGMDHSTLPAAEATIDSPGNAAYTVKLK